MTFLNPDKILDELELRDDIILKRDMTVVDFGCGSGGFTMPLAKRLDEGMIYAVDVQETSLSALKSRALLEKLNNIKYIRADLEKPGSTKIEGSSIDLVLIVNVLFQIEDKNAIIGEAKRILKKEGRLLVIDWLVQASQGPVAGRVSPQEVKTIAQNTGFLLKKELEAGKYHYGLVFSKL